MSTITLTRLQLAQIESLASLKKQLEVRLEHLTTDDTDVWFLARNIDCTGRADDEDAFTLSIEMARNALQTLLVEVDQSLARLGVVIVNN